MRIVASIRVNIGNNFLIDDECVVLDNDYHGIGSLPAKKAVAEIGDNVWLATRVNVLLGVKIGHFTVAGANSVVKKSLPDSSFSAGNLA